MRKIGILRKVVSGGLISLLCMPLVSPVRADSLVWVGECGTNYRPWNLVVQDSFVYLADRGSFVVIDVSDPANPWVRSKVEDNVTDRATSVFENIFVKDTLVYLRSEVFLTIINVANPDSLVMVGYVSGLPLWSFGLAPRGLYVSDTIAFVPNGKQSLMDVSLVVCNVKDPANPFIVDTFQARCAINVTMQDSVLFIATYDSLLIVNAKNPFNLSQISAISIPEKDYDVAVRDNYAYVTGMSSYGWDGKLKIVDISDLQNPQVVGEVTNIRGDPVAVYLENDYAYVAAKDWWLKKKEGKADVEGGIRIGFAAPESASLVASYDTPGNPQDVYVVGDLIFVADYDRVQILRHIHTGVEEREKLKVESIKLNVWPNPFKEQANIIFNVSSPTNGKIEIYDKTGRKVRTLYDGLLFPASYRFCWNGCDKSGKEVVGGEYFITLSIGDAVKEIKKVIYLK